MQTILARRRVAEFIANRQTLAAFSLALAGLAACDGSGAVDPAEPALKPRFTEIYEYNGITGLTAPDSASLNFSLSTSVSANAPTSVAAVLPAGSVAVEPQSGVSVNNCIPFGNNVSYGFTGFVYRNIPAFTLAPGDKIAFDLGSQNGQPIRRDIYFSAANKNPGPVAVSGFNLVSQNVRALQWVKVASESDTPANPFGNTVVGDYELAYTAITSFTFGGGGFMIGFASSPPAALPDGDCEQVLVNTTGFDASGKFYTRFLRRAHLDGGALDIGSGSDLTSSIGGFRIIKVNNAPSVEFADPDPATVNEGTPLSTSISATDPEGDALTYDATFGDGETVTNVPITESPFVVEHTYVDDAESLTFSVTVNDGGDGITTIAKKVTVMNVAPTVSEPTVPAGPIPAGSVITVSATFTDPGTADTHTGAIQWDVGGAFETAGVTTTDGIVTARKILAPGVYSVTLMVTDDDGGVGTSAATAYIVVYDPNGGFVTGGGWIISPAAACAVSTCAYTGEGAATFGFVSKYKPGAATPSGNTEFEFKTGGFNFKSTFYQWLVVAGARAQYKGEGRVNGGGDYGFLLTAIDGALQGGGSADQFRIKVWDKASGETVYDNRRSAAEDSDQATPLGGGSIVIHK